MHSTTDSRPKPKKLRLCNRDSIITAAQEAAERDSIGDERADDFLVLDVKTGPLDPDALKNG